MAKVLIGAVLLSLLTFPITAQEGETKTGLELEAAVSALQACLYSQGLFAISFMQSIDKIRERVDLLCRREINNLKNPNIIIEAFMLNYRDSLSTLERRR